MGYRKFLLERYLVKAVIPYLILAFLILTGLLLLQQSGKFAEVLSFSRDPFPLTLEILAGVVPGITLFTLPMSVLVGTSTGFARMGSDSELIALRAAGVNRLRLTAPVLLFGAVISLFALLDAFAIAPASVRTLRRVLARAALDRLESPIQPRTFNTQLAGKVIYVRDGDQTRGEWGRVFIHWPDSDGDLRLITARKGRLDAGEDQTELVLTDAVVTTIPRALQHGGEASVGIVSERSEQLRLKINGGRDTLESQLEREPDEEELGWGDLIERYRHGQGKTRREALSSLCKRLALALTPLPFILLGVGLGARARRGGRALGAVFSLLVMLSYYLVFLGGDYLSRSGAISPVIGSFAAAVLALLGGLWLILLSDVRLTPPPASSVRTEESHADDSHSIRREFRRLRLSLLGLLDRSVLTSLALYFLLSLAVLLAVFLLFTFFETLRLAEARGTPSSLVPLYLLYLIPFASTTVLPVATMLSVLTTYALMARRNEAVSWWSTGQSFYRLALPSLVFALLICALYYSVQEHVLPAANRRQNALRSQIRGEPARAGSASGFQWLAASDTRLYSYKYKEATGELEGVTAYRFDDEGIHLKEVERAESGRPTQNGGLMLEGVSTVSGLDMLGRGVTQGRAAEVADEGVQFYLFKPMLKQPNEYETQELRDDLKELSSPRLATSSSRLNALRVTFWKRRLEPFNSLVMWINALPLAIAFGRRSVIRPLALAILLGLCFWLGGAVLSQAGTYGLISPQLAALILPTALFLSGIYLLSKART